MIRGRRGPFVVEPAEPPAATRWRARVTSRSVKSEPEEQSIKVPYRQLIHVAGQAPERWSPAVLAAMKLQLDLMGAGSADDINTVNAFLPRARHRGRCRSCGQLRNLTFEHLPPAAAGNNVRARGVSVLDILTSTNPDTFPRAGWVPSQRGVGAYVLCKPCNEFFGSRYVRPYVAFSRDIGLNSIRAIRERGTGVIPGFVTVDLEGWPLGDIAREGLVQLLDLGIHDHLIRQFPVLKSIVLTGADELPAGLALGLTLVLNTDQGRVSSPMLAVDDPGLATETVTLFTEVSMAPFSWTLSFTGNGRQMLDRTADVSDWLRLAPGEVAGSTPLELPVGTIGSARPGDFSFDLPGAQPGEERPDLPAE